MLSIASSPEALGQGTAFTYQGQLQANGSPASGSYNLTFTLYAASTGGSPVAGPVTNSAINVTDGLFTVTIDFGSNVWAGTTNWLQIGVETNGGGGFTLLNPRQEVAPTPAAIFAETARAAGLSGTIPASSLGGTYSGAVNLSNSGNTFAGNGGGLTSLNAGQLTTGQVPSAALGNAWKLAGNTGANPTNDNFLGTADNLPLELRVNGTRGLRLQPNTNAAPAVIAGSSSNAIDFGAIGAAIGGGDFNYIQQASPDAVIAGGVSNQVLYLGIASTIAGGMQNTMWVNSEESFIAGGYLNLMEGNVYECSIGGGEQNDIQELVQDSSIGGGLRNQIRPYVSYSSIAGGQNNIIYTNVGYSSIGGGWANGLSANYSIIGGGQFSAIASNADWSVISGGNDNNINYGSSYSFIGGGNANTIDTNAFRSTIGGGLFNDIQPGAQYSFIGGGDANQDQTNASFGVMGGGSNNQIQTNAQYAVLVGGQLNTVSPNANFSAIGGGKANTIGLSSYYATIAGGGGNTTSDDFSTVAGGIYNNSGGYAATVAGGGENTSTNDYAAVGGGYDNNASGYAATVAGGFENSAAGDYSFAGGNGAYAPGNRSFVWNSFPNSNYATGTNEFFVFAENGFSVDYNNQLPWGGGDRWLYIGKGDAGTFGTVPATISTWTGAYLSDGGAWTSSSDRARKENFAPVEARSVLEKVAAMPIQTWNYTNEPAVIRHLGPVSQDFHAAFGLNGEDDTHITVVDEAGVALAAIKGLNQKLDEKDKTIQSQATEIDELKARLARIEALLATRSLFEHQ